MRLSHKNKAYIAEKPNEHSDLAEKHAFDHFDRIYRYFHSILQHFMMAPNQNSK